MRTTLIAAAIAILLAPSVSLAEEVAGAKCTAEKQVLDELKMAMDNEAAQMQRESEQVSKADDLSLKFEVEMETVDVRYHVPEYQGMTRQDFSLDLPQFKMRRSDYSFDVPTFKWDTTVVGKYLKCRHLRCDWEDIKTKVPKWYNKTVKASWDIPEVRMDRTGFSLDLPKFGLQEVTWKFDVPRFRLKEVHIGEKPIYDSELKERSKELESRGQAMAAKYEAEMKDAANAYIGCFAAELKATRANSLAQFDSGIATLRAAAAGAAASGSAPVTVRSSAGEIVSFDAMIKDLEAKRAAFITDIDAQIERVVATDADDSSDQELASTAD